MSSVKLGWETKLWSMADKLRGNIESSEYKHVILGLVFLKYVSDAFEERYGQLEEEGGGAFKEETDAYAEIGVFFVPQKARWEYVKKNAKLPTIGQIIDDAMVDIESVNSTLKGVLPKNYARSALDKHKLGELVDMLSFKMGDKESRAKDVLGRVYEFFLGKFGKIEGTFYTPPSIVKLLVEMLKPYKGRVYDPCCGSGGMFIQSQKFVEQHSGRRDDIHIFGQEYTSTTWKLCKMNLAIRGIDGNIGSRDADTFTNDLHKRLKADFIMANPPFNMKDWGANRLQEDVRWKYGMPSANNANYAWIQHIVSKLSPSGIAGFVLANGSLSSNKSNDGEIRKNLIENHLVDCIVTLPGQLFYTVQIPVSLWFLSKNKKDKEYRDRTGEILFIDASKLGYMEDRTHKSLDDEKDIKKIADTYHTWKSNDEKTTYKDIKGFCKSAKLDEVRKHEYILTPGRYVGIEEVEDNGEPFDEKMTRLTEELSELFVKSKKLEEEIRKNLGSIGYEF